MGKCVGWQELSNHNLERDFCGGIKVEEDEGETPLKHRKRTHTYVRVMRGSVIERNSF